jgi:hypothetical protein
MYEKLLQRLNQFVLLSSQQQEELCRVMRFVAGLVWAEYYRNYRSIWSNYFSHMMADLALYIAAWHVFFH